jgi:hypothetical protein
VLLRESDGKPDAEASERLRRRWHIQQITPLDASSFRHPGDDPDRRFTRS